MKEGAFRLEGKSIWVAGHRGMVGSAIVRRLASEKCEILISNRAVTDLRIQSRVEEWVGANRPQVVIVAAARVGGILANSSYPAEFLYDNLAIEANIIHASHQFGVEKLLFLGSSCIYPKLAEQPIAEDSLLTGALEQTNEWYAVAKIAGIKLGQAYRQQYGADFISAMPTNLYGPGDNFDLSSSHVLPALIRKTHEAKWNGSPSVTIWGTGEVYREFMHVDDLADACVFLLKNYSDQMHVNVGVGEDLTIRMLAGLVAEVVGYSGGFVYDTTKPDGAPRKLLDVTRLANLGWNSKISLKDGIRDVYEWYLRSIANSGG